MSTEVEQELSDDQPPICELPPMWLVNRYLWQLVSAEHIIKEVQSPENPNQCNELFHHLFVNGFNAAIQRFNEFPRDHPLMKCCPKAAALKQKIGDKQIPFIQELSPQAFRRGIRAALGPMLKGQELKGLSNVDGQTRAYAIGTPSMDTNALALGIGTGAHLLERTVFEHFRSEGTMTNWVKDDVLCALEEIIVLMYVEYLDGKGEYPQLFEFISSPNSLTREGGLGWVNKKQVAQCITEYSKIMRTGEHKNGLFTGSVRWAMGEDLETIRIILQKRIVGRKESTTREEIDAEIETKLGAMRKAMESPDDFPLFLVATATDGFVVGVVGMRTLPYNYQKNFADLKNDEIELINLYTDDNHSQGTGVGTALVGRIIHETLIRGFKKFWLASGRRYHPTWEYYKKQKGFRDEGIVDGFYEENGELFEAAVFSKKVR